MTFCEGIGDGHRKKRIDFGGDSDSFMDSGLFSAFANMIVCVKMTPCGASQQVLNIFFTKTFTDE